jgi:FAD synthetase
MKKVLVFGTFDGLHPGHIDFLEQAKKQGDYLIAVVARDSTVLEVKGRRPKRNETQRFEGVKKSGLVDEAILGGESDRYQVIGRVKPDVIALGYDQEAFTRGLPAEIKKMGLTAKIVRLKPHHPECYHSAILNKK